MDVVNNSDLEKVWNVVYRALQHKFGSPVVNSWISPLSVDKFYSGTLYIKAPSMFLRDWVVNNYSDIILEFCRKENKEIKSIEIFVSSSRSVATEKTSKNLEKSSEKFLKSEEKVVFGIPLDPKFTFENFVVGKPNEFAYAAALRVAESDKVAFNPLFLYGAVGLGKTHLMHAIAWNIQARSPRRNIAYMSAEKFMYHFVRSVRFKDTMAFKEQFRSVDVLMIDDIQFICGKDSTQEEFFHTFNALVDNNRQVIVSADKSPSDLDGMEERLKSRLGWGLVADIHPTNYELRLGILQTKAAACSVKVPSKVLEFIAHKITTNIRELEGALNRVVASAVFVGREITMESAREILSDLLRTSDRKVTVEEIQKKVAAHYSVKFSDMSSVRRARQVALPRQVAMYLAKKLTTMSLPEIGKCFGGRDHTTVIHAVKKINELTMNDGNLAEDIRLLNDILTK
ncbi:MAG: chromosomal replication initiator protein DnaA [Holosporaceae bacterium]|jgi:chromosomal replication initiator protein|nr:chromosomal replication initiator protein DnaA [Holosporaceae bacterium]